MILPVFLHGRHSNTHGTVSCFRAPCTDTNAALHYYSHDNVHTSNGVLNITTEQKVNSYKAFDEKKKVFYADKKYIQSGMLQSWNKFCFIGGAVEFSAQLPGDPHKGGLWPACESNVFSQQ
jgi:beta-glucanase (GH16 family)